MDTALVIMIGCDADNHKFRERLQEWHNEGESVYWTIADYQNVYAESGWKEENEGAPSGA